MTANYVDKIMNVQLSLVFVHIQQEPYKNKKQNKTKQTKKQTKNKQTNKQKTTCISKRKILKSFLEISGEKKKSQENGPTGREKNRKKKRKKKTTERV